MVSARPSRCWGSKMAKASIQRNGYSIDYLGFIPRNNDWRIEGNGNEYTFAADGKTVLTTTPFSVRLSSEVDSAATLQAYLDKHAVLTVARTQATIDTDGIAACVFTVAGNGACDFRILRYNIEVAAGNTPDGAVVFATIVAGEYWIEMKNANGQTGYSGVIANAS